MKKSSNQEVVVPIPAGNPISEVTRRIFLIRGQRVMIDRELAATHKTIMRKDFLF